MSNSILIFAYYSYKDPVFQSAVLPYFINFPKKENYQFVLLTFEQQQYALSQQEEQEIKAVLNQENILWYHKRWHSGKFKPLKKIYDFLYSIFFSLKLIQKHKIKIIYSEGFPGAILTHFISIFSGKPQVVHTFEPHADYMRESGVWNESFWEYKLLKRFEIAVAKKSAAILTATQKMIDNLSSIAVNSKFMRVPSCVDLAIFSFREKDRIDIRTRYGIRNDEIVLVYSGKFGGMYWDVELFQLFNAFEKYGKASYRYLILSIEEKQKILTLNNNIIGPDKLIIERLSRLEVPKYLSASDGGVCAIKNIPSRRYSSPIKNGEYWACGLPVIIPEGISDDYLLTEEHDIGVVLKECTEDSFKEAVYIFEDKFFSQEWSNVKTRASDFVKKDRNVDHYKKEYHLLFNSLKK